MEYCKPLFSDNGGGKDNIILVNGDKIVSDDAEVAQSFNDFFKNTLSSLDITVNRFLISETNNEINDVNIAITKFENHPNIISIKENVKVDLIFSFSEVTADKIIFEIKSFYEYPSQTIDTNC